MKINRSVEFPTKGKEIKVKHLKKYMKLSEAEKAKDFNILFVFAGDLTKYIKKDISDGLADDLRSMLSANCDFTQSFAWEGSRYGFITNLDDISVGEYLDIQALEEMDLWANCSRLMTILYRPIIEEAGDDYRIESYQGINEKLAKSFEDLPAEVVIGSIGFFLLLSADLRSNSQNSSSPRMNRITYRLIFLVSMVFTIALFFWLTASS